MNDKLKAGLVMQGIQFVFLIVVGAGFFLSGIDWTTDLVMMITIITIIALFNISSVILIVAGLFMKDKPKESEIIANDYY